MQTCNIEYTSASKEKLKNNIRSLWGRHLSDDAVVSRVQRAFGRDGNTTISLTEVTDQGARDFINDVTAVICEFDRHSPEMLSNEAKKLRNAILSAFFSMNEALDNSVQEKDINNAGNTDENLRIEKEKDLQEALDSVYGGGSISLRNDLQDSFSRELRKRLIYNPDKNLMHQFDLKQVNALITEYKKLKFLSILNYLKKQYPDDTKLNGITEMYSYGYINGNSYDYVLDLFRKHIGAIENLSDVLDSDLNKRISLQFKEKQEEAYRKLIQNVVLKDSELSSWFKKKFNTTYEFNNASNNLFLAGRFTSYYNLVKERVEEALRSNPTYAAEARLLLKTIESPDNDLLTIVNNYIKLAYFDDLLLVELSEYFTFDKKTYQKNNPSPSIKSLKYEIKESHKHQNAGFETFDKEGSESHTSTTVKRIVGDIPIYSYINGQPTGRYMDMNTLMLAWQSLVLDIINGDFDFRNEASNKEEIKAKFNELVNRLSFNTIDRASELLALLFEKGADNGGAKGWETAAVKYLTGTKTLSPDHLHILYSFYHDVLNKNNPYSKISLELDALNDPDGRFKGQYLPIASDLTAVLYRNVSNTYLDCSLQGKNRSFKIKAKFSWNSELFDMLEGCSFASKIRQYSGIGIQEKLNDYSFKSIPGSKFTTVEISLNGLNGEPVKFVYECKDSKYGMFAVKDSDVMLTKESREILQRLSDIDIDSVKAKLLSDKTENLTEDEYLLKQVLTFLDDYLKFGFLSEFGLDTLKHFKLKYPTFHQDAKVRSPFYLEHLLKLAMRTADIDNEVQEARNNGKTFKQYLESNTGVISKYHSAYISHKNDGNLGRMFSMEGSTKVYLIPVERSDKILDELAKSRVIAEGRSTRSTSLNKSGATVSNYSVARAGSELSSRLYEQRNFHPTEGFVAPAQNLIFVKNDGMLRPDPVIDGEVTTLIGDVKAVKDLSTSELFQHAMLDKFYMSFINRGEICFQPTVYSDKTQFLNWFAKVSKYDKDGKSIMDLTRTDVEDVMQEEYVTSFFQAHRDILSNIVTKYNILTGGVVKDIVTLKQYLKSKSDTDLRNAVMAYNKANPSKEIALELDKDYRVNKATGKCDVNEIIEFYSNLVVNKRARTAYFNQQKKIFLDNLKENDVTFKLFDSKSEMNLWINQKPKEDSDGKSEEHYPNYLLDIISSTKLLGFNSRKKFVEEWVDQTNGELILEKDGKLNPFLEKFFYIEGLYSNNLRLSLTGTEGNHPDKSKGTIRGNDDLNEAIEKVIKYPDNQGILEGLKNQLEELGITVGSDEEVKEFVNMFNQGGTFNKMSKVSVSDFNNDNKIAKQIYDRDIITIINTAQGTQFKRNVIITATLQHPIPGKIDGVTAQVRGAVVKDMPAPVNNLRESDKIDSQDGSAKMSPIQVILENNSLGDQRVGTNRKPIWDDLTEDLTSFLAKFAAFSDTNAMMLQSAESKSGQYMMFKKMHHIRWGGGIDLTHKIQMGLTIPMDKKDLKSWFKNVICEGKTLLYKDQFGEIKEITGFGKEKGVYYTMERVHGSGSESTQVFHYFNDNGDHFKSDKLVRPNGQGQFLLEGVVDETQTPVPLHTIDSLYELHKVIGGIWNCNSDGSASEFNLKVLTNFVNNVGYRKAGTTKIRTADDVVQPLKDKFIAYVFNSSAVKNGAKNVNKAEAWTDPNYELSTFKINTKGLGIQLNADHDVTDEELTEFSQVVAACAAYGKDFSTINEIYYGLAESAFQASKDELDNVNDFLRNTKDPEAAKYKLYKIVAKLILKSRSNSDSDLTERLKYEINQSFKIDKDGSSSELRVPFSDPSVYSRFITSITSVINLKSIKRKHPGSGYVMAPGYNVVQYFQINDGKGYKKYMFTDVLNAARKDYRMKLIEALKANNNGSTVTTFNGKNFDFKYATIDQLRQIAGELDFNTLIKEDTDPEVKKNLEKLISYHSIKNSDVHDYNRALVAAYIADKQAAEELRSKEWFMPTDNVDILDLQGNVIKSGVSLDDMNDYYKFKDGIKQAEVAHNVTIERTVDKKGVRKFRIKLNEDIKGEGKEFVLEQVSKDEQLYNIHFRTGTEPSPLTFMRRGKSTLSDEQRARLFKATLEVLPLNAEIQLSDSTREQLETKQGGLGQGSIAGFLSISPEASNKKKMESRIGNTVLQVVPGSETIVHYFDNEGIEQQQQVTRYKKTGQLTAYNYRMNITSPVNLKPSLIRWLYVDKQGRTRFMTIYDHPIIKNAWNIGKSPEHQKEIQQLLDNLDKGFFEMNGVRYDIVPGSLENTEAEIVLGNMYKRIFGIENESLADILDKGEDYFREKMKDKVVPKIPKGFYDFAFTRNNGNHVLISLGTVNTGFGITEVPFDRNQEQVNDDGEIKVDDIKIGKYIDAPSDWKYVPGTEGEIGYVIDGNGNIVDSSKYRLLGIESGDITVQKRIDYVKRYSLERVDTVNGKEQSLKYTLYQISDVNVVKEGLNKVDNRPDSKNKGKEFTDEELTNAAFNLISSILKNMFDLDNYSDIVINTGVTRNLEDESSVNKLDNIKTRKYLAACLGTNFGSKYRFDKKSLKFKELTEEDIQKLSSFDKHMIKVKELLENDERMSEDGKPLKINFLQEYELELNSYHDSKQHYRKQWTSFLNSLHFISSRIPAQSLQSFMPMVCVGWTSDLSNTAYVSYIQTYLQGSDYDIDKAYVMGQSFTDDGEYIKWSNLFDFSSYETIAASKTLPVPRGLELKSANEKYNIDTELTEILLAIEKKDKVAEIKGYAKLIKKIDALNGLYWNTMDSSDQVKHILNKVQAHENYKIPFKLREAGYKNVASANIWANVHNIRNRDQAYSPITMRDLQDAADNTPKGEKTKTLNMLNPLTKYIMQNQNLVGKGVIGIAANGEKDWFNLTYYYHNLLRIGDPSDLFFLKMEHNYTRIQGRAAWSMPAGGITVKHIPDLWLADGTFDKKKADSQIANRMKEVFYSESEFEKTDVNDKYVDQLISQLLSAATDNAKELILARINAGTNLAKYYLHLMMMGFSLDDIVAFMTSPVVELIDRYSRNNFYDKKIATVNSAIKLLNGDLKLSQFLVRPKVKLSLDQRMEIEQAELESAIAEAEMVEEAMAEGIRYKPASKEYKWVTDTLKLDGKNIYLTGGFKNLEEFIKLYIQAKIATPAEIADKKNRNHSKLELLRDYKLPKTDNFNTNLFFEFVDNIINNINQTINEYNEKHPKQNYTLADLKMDLDEFSRLSDEANETSTLASVWLKLNQGIPQTDIDIIKRIKRMNNSISTREGKFGIRRLVNVSRRQDIILADDDDVEKDEQQRTTNKSKEEYINNLIDAKIIIDRINQDTTIAEGQDKEALIMETMLSELKHKKYKEMFDVLSKIKANNNMLTMDEIVTILIDAVDADLFGNFDIYKYLSDENVVLKDHSYKVMDENGQPVDVQVRYSAYKDKDGNPLQSNLISYRELSSRYYNLIKSSWNILDIMRRIPHYEKNLDLLNYTLQQRILFPNKSKIVDRLIGLGDLSYLTLTDLDYKKVVNYADKILNVAFFFSLKDKPINISKCAIDINGEKKLPVLYNRQYDLIPQDILYLDSLNGIDSLKHFVENEFLNWLKRTYPNNPLVKDLDLRSNRGKSILRTRLNLDLTEASLSNQQTFNNYLIGIKQLGNVKFDENYTVADILALYNLAVNGTKLGGKYLTSIFRDSVRPGTILHEYYKYLGNTDYDRLLEDIHPTKRDFLIYLAPTVYSEAAVAYRTEPYVKVAHPTRGFDLHRREYDRNTHQWKYKKVNIEDILLMDGMVDADKRDERLYEFTSNSLTTFPELHKRMMQESIFSKAINDSLDERLAVLEEYIKASKLLIYKDCR